MLSKPLGGSLDGSVHGCDVFGPQRQVVLVRWVDGYCRIDCPGVCPARGQRRLSRHWDDRIAVNPSHQFFSAQAVLPDMKQANDGNRQYVVDGGWV
jgi:hypothetical protein